jgi:transcriptional regulator with XRE-family HTH domain
VEKGHPELGMRIRELRLEKSLSQEAFTHGKPISNRQFQRIERGKADLQLSTLYDIAALLGMTGSELISGLDPRPDGQPTESDPEDEARP